MTLQECINQFCRRPSYHCGVGPGVADSILRSKKPFSFTALLKEKGSLDQLESENPDPYIIRETVAASVTGYPSGKDTAIRLYRQLFRLYSSRTGVILDQNLYPPIAVSNNFERLMFIAKYLQDPEAHIDDLPDLLWVSSRTVEDDLKKLRARPGETNEDAIQILGRPFTIPETSRENGTLTFSSTTHPLFLTWNLTQVITALKGLHIMCTQPSYRYYALTAAADLWMQLSDYAKKRITYVCGNLLPDDLEWYRSLEGTGERPAFSSEYQCSRGGSGCCVLMDCIKNRKRCFVEYWTDTGSEFLTDCLAEGLQDGQVRVRCDQGVFLLEEDRILRSAYRAEDLI